ncbi:MAG: ParB/RepB/Spo0J family partition protein [Chloroflexota bacterium]
MVDIACPHGSVAIPVDSPECSGCPLRSACPLVYTPGWTGEVPMDLLVVRLQIHQSVERIPELAHMIAVEGLFDPLVVRPVDGRLEIVDGVRRYAGLSTLGAVACRVLVVHRSDVDAVATAAMLNMQRQSLHWIEEAAVVEYLSQRQWPPEKIAKQCGRKIGWVYERKRFWIAVSEMDPTAAVFRGLSPFGPLFRFVDTDAPAVTNEDQPEPGPCSPRLLSASAFRAVLDTTKNADERRALAHRASEDGLRESDVRAVGELVGGLVSVPAEGLNQGEDIPGANTSPDDDASVRFEPQRLPMPAPLALPAGRHGWPAALDSYLKMIGDGGTLDVRRSDLLRILYALLAAGDVRAFLDDHGVPRWRQHEKTNLYLAAVEAVAHLDQDSLVADLLALARNVADRQFSVAS